MPKKSRLQGDFDQGLAFYQAGKLERARDTCRKILKRQPDHFDALHLLGVIALQTGHIQRAVAFLEKAVAINPGISEAHSNLGHGLCGLNRFDEAIDCYDKAIALNPDQAYLSFNRGNALRDLGRHEAAVESYDRAITLRPDYAEAYNNRGIALRALKQYQAALHSCDRAIALKPDYVEAYCNHGNALCDLKRHDEGIAAYHKAIALKPDYAEAYGNLGNALSDLNRHDESIASHHKAIALKPDYAEAWINLGTIVQSLGKLDEAGECYRKALAIEPDLTEAHRHIAGLKKFTGHDHDFKAMEAAWARPDLSEDQKMHLAFGLGKASEDMRQYETAFEFFKTGNAIKRAGYDFSIKDVETQFNDLKGLFTKKLFSDHPGPGSSDATPIFILGMPRSGTSLVEQILASHPQIHGAGELDDLIRTIDADFGRTGDAAFADRIKGADSGGFSCAGDKYVKKIREQAGDAKFVTDKMPQNFRWIGMIQLMLPNARIIHCRRDPMDTCLSIFKTLFAVDGHYYAYELGELGQYYSLYRDLMSHWNDVMPDFIYDIRYEDVIADQETHTRALLDYCGLDWNDACLQFHKTDRPVHTASSAQVRRPIYKNSVQSWKNYENWLSPLSEAL
ncbi:MAG: tetratricopeptide repeat protein [Rhodospirillales bacterium]|nr:tetratricopeptide repeat protein [Rhodospirillales bacterium]